jgi:hypothetical protein
MQIPEIIKAHPLPIIGGGLALLVVAMMMRGSSPATSSGTSANDVAALANQNATNVQLAQTAASAQVAINTANDSLLATKAAAASDQQKTIASLAANQTGSLVSAVLGMLSVQQSNHASDNALTSNLATAYSGVATHAMDTELQAATLAAHTSVSLAGINSATYLGNKSLDNQLQSQLAGYQSAQMIAGLNSQTAQAITVSNNNAKIATNANSNQAAQTQASTNQTTSYVQDAVAVASIAAMFM